MKEEEINEIKRAFLEKFRTLALRKPLNFDLNGIDVLKLYGESQVEVGVIYKIHRFGFIFESLEGLKQITSEKIRTIGPSGLSLLEAIIFQDLIQIQVVYEFLKGLKIDQNNSPNIFFVREKLNAANLRKLRNSVAHFDWKREGNYVNFGDTLAPYKVDFIELSEFCSLISMIPVLMTRDFRLKK